MKNVLLASTALVLTAGLAAAEINFGGSARLGVVYDSTPGATDELAIHNRFTLNIDGSTETDSGIEFFARVRVRGGNEGTGATSSSGVSAPRVGLSVSGVTVAVGNITGAIEETPGLYDGAVGLTGLGDLNVVALSDFDSFSSNGGGDNGVEVIYGNGNFGTHLSYSPVTENAALNASYAFGDWTVAAAYQDSDNAADDTWLVTAGGSFGNYRVGAAYGDTDGVSKVRVNGSATFGAGTTVTAFIADDESAAETIWGLGFTHSLGGATLAGGVVGDEDGENQADLGVRFSF
ncbi:MAG: porin [Shimia sp.]|jgi:outer membrane protein OmpU|uniref:porin n=1 Tax=Shimia sp. TaxID=1954381 RepID=UPI004059F381